jgi:ABC-type Zn uptake system ZnuABC Zn-binding protein ZnuA
VTRLSLRIFAGALVALAGTIPFLGCGRPASAVWPPSNGPRVAVSFPPLYCFAANVVGDYGTVKSVLTAQGPHHADTNVQERVILEEADLFLVNGLGLDDSLARGLAASTGNKRLKIIELGEKLPESCLLESDGSCCVHEDGKDHNHGDHAHDPHIWTSPVVAQKLVEEIRTALRTANSSQAAAYDKNAAEYLAKLKKLTDDGKAMMKTKKDKNIVTMHGSMNYFANAFGLTVVGVIQKTPGQEPNDHDLKALIADCVKNKVRVIAVEPQYGSQGAALEIKKELLRSGIEGVEIVELDNMETATPAELNPDWYETKMRANLDVLAKVLK